MTSFRTRVLVAAVPLVVGLAGCASATSVASPAATPKTTSAAPASPTPTPSATPSGTGEATPEPVLATVPGYTYVEVQGAFSSLGEQLKGTGLITAVAAKSVKDAAGKDVAAIFLAQYNPKLSATIDVAPIGQVLDGAAKGAQAFTKEPGKISNQVLAGVPARLFQTKSLSVLVAYKKGGVLVEIFGPNAAELLKFGNAYFAVKA